MPNPMQRRFQASALLAGLALRAAAWIVPSTERADWHAEWSAELWHLLHSADNKIAPLDFVRGAFPDALCLRREARPDRLPDETELHPAPRMQSGTYRCIATLAVACAVAFALALILPGPRRALLPHRYAGASDLVLITHSGSEHLDIPSIQLADYRSWRGSTQRLYSDLAFYLPQQLSLQGEQQPSQATLILASSNLFSMLSLSPQPLTEAQPGQPRLIVSNSFQKRLHHAQSIEIAGQSIAIAGVLDDDQWQLPGHADAWLLADDTRLAGISPLTHGFVLARVLPGAFPSSHRVMIDGDHRYPCLSLAGLTDRPLVLFRFALLLAMLGLPATLAIPLGASARRTRRLRLRLRAWGYLTAKFALSLPLAYAASLLLAYSRLAPESDAAPYLQTAAAFFSLLFLFRWSWQDQRSRCPECLGRLTHPAKVGLASRSFLAWSGTELVCTSGHGLLHIPELPTSWFSAPRWLALDASWKPLFASPIP